MRDRKLLHVKKFANLQAQFKNIFSKNKDCHFSKNKDYHKVHAEQFKRP